MKRLILAALLGGAAALAACDGPDAADQSVETADATLEAPVAPAVEDAAVPAADPSAVDAPPVDDSALPPEKRTSEETVQPNSETLFY